MAAKIRPPAGLSRAAREWWRTVCEEYDLDPHHLHLLRLACEALDQATEARHELDEHGSIFNDRFGQPKESPWVQIEHRARNDFRVLCRELGLDAASGEDLRMRRDITYGKRR